MMQTTLKLVVALIVSAFLFGCTSQDTMDDDTQATVVDQSTSADDADSDDADSTAMVTEDTSWAGHALDNPESLLSTKTVYFDFDRADVRPQDRSTIEAHAQWLQNHPNSRIALEGHADERGTREYNNALGESRAKAVRSLLTLIGGSAQQVQLLSYGEERPANRAHTEEAWAANRRVVIEYLTRE